MKIVLIIMLVSIGVSCKGNDVVSKDTVEFLKNNAFLSEEDAKYLPKIEYRSVDFLSILPLLEQEISGKVYFLESDSTNILSIEIIIKACY
ncbi:MAG: hypothetical protein HWD86_06625 [Kangiellaceae bacterium]|nr:hypothetical protein [Kangiellaceae bacterium]